MVSRLYWGFGLVPGVGPDTKAKGGAERGDGRGGASGAPPLSRV